MRKIGIIICGRYKECGGGKCLRAMRERVGGFARYPADEELELVGYSYCGDCPGGNVEYVPGEMIENGAEAIHLAHDTHNLLQLGIALQAAAVQAAAVSEWVRAARLWGAGGALAPQWPLFQRRYGELIADAQTALGPAFAEELARGATLPLPEVLALAPVR